LVSCGAAKVQTLNDRPGHTRGVTPRTPAPWPCSGSFRLAGGSGLGILEGFDDVGRDAATVSQVEAGAPSRGDEVGQGSTQLLGVVFGQVDLDSGSCVITHHRLV
jgi:hypothetical protein